jgi:DNA topoisomerase-1
VLGTDPVTGYDVVARAGRYGPYVSLVLPEGSKDKPPTGSLFASMDLETITLEQALKLLTLPRVLGEHEGEPVTAQNGRYGPYISRLKESRSLESEEALFEIDLEQALALLATPKTYGRKAAAPSRRSRSSARPGQRRADGRQGGPLRAVRHRRRDQRLAAQGRRHRVADRRARCRAAGRAARPRSGAEEDPAKKAPPRRPGQEGAARKAPAKKAAAKKA